MAPENLLPTPEGAHAARIHDCDPVSRGEDPNAMGDDHDRGIHSFHPFYGVKEDTLADVIKAGVRLV